MKKNKEFFYNEDVDAIIYKGQAVPGMTVRELKSLALAFLDQAQVDIDPIVDLLAGPNESWDSEQWKFVGPKIYKRDLSLYIYKQ